MTPAHTATNIYGKLSSIGLMGRFSSSTSSVVSGSLRDLGREELTSGTFMHTLMEPFMLMLHKLPFMQYIFMIVMPKLQRSWNAIASYNLTHLTILI